MAHEVVMLDAAEIDHAAMKIKLREELGDVVDQALKSGGEPGLDDRVRVQL